MLGDKSFYLFAWAVAFSKVSLQIGVGLLGRLLARGRIITGAPDSHPSPPQTWESWASLWRRQQKRETFRDNLFLQFWCCPEFYGLSRKSHQMHQTLRRKCIGACPENTIFFGAGAVGGGGWGQNAASDQWQPFNCPRFQTSSCGGPHNLWIRSDYGLGFVYGPCVFRETYPRRKRLLSPCPFVWNTLAHGDAEPPLMIPLASPTLLPFPPLPLIPWPCACHCPGCVHEGLFSSAGAKAAGVSLVGVKADTQLRFSWRAAKS